MSRTTATVAASLPDHWEELVTTALLGTDRRTPPGAAPGPRAPSALLDAVAAATVRRRAGLRPARPAERLRPAPEDPRPPLPPAAARRLAVLLADRPGASGGGRRGASPDLMELLPQWLQAANAHGYAAPPHALPALLDAARGRTDLRPAALRFAGPRALWLARLNPDWRFALRAAPGGGPSAPDLRDPQGIRRLWQEGLFAERVTLLTALRSRDAAAARALLEETWATERAEDRLMFLDSLRAGLGPDDEPFLERALADRSRNVRATAAELLSALPASALAARMAVRAAACVAVDRTRDVPTIVVEAPHECDAAMERTAWRPRRRPAAVNGRGGWGSWWRRRRSAPGRGGSAGVPRRRSWRCRSPTAGRASCTRPGAGRRCGSGTRPGRARCSGSRPRRRRAVPGRCPWPSAPGCWPPWTPVNGRCGWPGSSRRTACPRRSSCSGCAVPWAPPLGRAVVDALNIARDAGSYPWSFSGVMGLAERCLDPSEASRLDALLAIPDEPEDAAPGATSYWSEAFQRLVTTLRLRGAMLAELAPEEPAPDRTGRPGHLPAHRRSRTGRRPTRRRTAPSAPTPGDRHPAARRHAGSNSRTADTGGTGARGPRRADTRRPGRPDTRRPRSIGTGRPRPARLGRPGGATPPARRSAPRLCLRGLPDVRPYPVHDGRRGRARREDLRDALLLQRRDVRLGDDAAAEDEDVLRVPLLQQVDDLREERVVRAREDGQADRVGVLLDRGVDDLLGVWWSPV